MSIHLDTGSALTRDGVYFNQNASWTRAIWIRPGASSPVGSESRTFWVWGDPTYAGAYIWLGQYSDGLISLEWGDGLGGFADVSGSLTPSIFAYFIATYDQPTHVMTLVGVSVSHVSTVIGSMVKNLSTITFATTLEAIDAGGVAPLQVGDFDVFGMTVWQSRLTVPEMVIQSHTPGETRQAALGSWVLTYLPDPPAMPELWLRDTYNNDHAPDFVATGSISPTDSPAFAVSLPFTTNFSDFDDPWTIPSNLGQVGIGSVFPTLGCGFGPLLGCGNNTAEIWTVPPDDITLPDSRTELAVRGRFAFTRVIGGFNPGFPPDSGRRVLEVFNTRDTAGSVGGSGLGLNVISGGAIVLTFGGSDSVQSAAGAFPIDGFQHGVQWILSNRTSTSVDYLVTVDDTTVLSGSRSVSASIPFYLQSVAVLGSYNTTGGEFSAWSAFEAEGNSIQRSWPGCPDAVQIVATELSPGNWSLNLCSLGPRLSCHIAVAPTIITGCDESVGINLTLADAIDELASRLDDVNFVHWTELELAVYLREALRTYSAFTQKYRNRAAFAPTTSQPFYDLPTAIPTLRSYNVTDVDLITDIEYALMEPPTPTAWTGTEQFTLPLIVECVQSRLNQFLEETGGVLELPSTVLVPDANGRVALPRDVITIRRAAWRMDDGTVIPLKREDEWAMQHYTPQWPQNPTAPNLTWPTGYSVGVTPPLVMQLSPAPTASGTLELVAVTMADQLDPTTGVLLGVPDDWSWVIKWGALSEILSRDGLGFDPQRSAYCEARYQQGVKMAKAASVVLQGYVDGRTTSLKSLVETDVYRRNWQSVPGVPKTILTAGWNVVGLNPPPDGSGYTITLDVVSNVFVPTQLIDCLPLDQFQRDCFMDYAVHLSRFKEGPDQLQSSMQLYENFARCCGVTIALDLAAVPNRKALFDQQFQDERVKPREEPGK